MSDPNSSSVKLRFTEFADTDDSIINFALEEAKLLIGTNSSKLRSPMILYLTAHIIVSGQIAAASGAGELASVSLGRISVAYRQQFRSGVDTSSVTTDLQSTEYGRRYLRLLNKSSKAFEVI